MEQRDGREDARIARDRCLQAIVESEDFETQRSLWRAALRFNRRDKAEPASGDCASGLHAPTGEVRRAER